MPKSSDTLHRKVVKIYRQVPSRTILLSNALLIFLLSNALTYILDIKMFKEDADNDELRARIALVAWQDKNGAEATKTTMIETLTAIGMEEMATSVFGSDKMEE